MNRNSKIKRDSKEKKKKLREQKKQEKKRKKLRKKELKERERKIREQKKKEQKEQKQKMEDTVTQEQTMQIDCASSDSRRDTRLGTIIAIIAILFTICKVLFQLVKSVISAWPESGYLYQVFAWSLFLIPLSATIVICTDIVKYVLNDLRRYNLCDTEYLKYDHISDINYASIIKDFKIMLGVIIVVCMIFMFIFSIFEKEWQSYIVMISFLLMLILAVVVGIYNVIKKKVKWKSIWYIIQRVIMLIFVAFVVFTFAFIFILRRSGMLNCDFKSTGIITVENAIDDTYGECSIAVYDEHDSQIDKENVLKSDVLFAKESLRQSLKQISRGQPRNKGHSK